MNTENKDAQPVSKWLRLWRWIVSVKGSAIAFLVSIVFCFLLIGMVGLLLYYPVAPILLLLFPHIDQMSGDWVWPAVLMVNVLWSFGLLLAGTLDLRLVQRSSHWLMRCCTYLLVLWLWALITWFFVLSTMPPQG